MDERRFSGDRAFEELRHLAKDIGARLAGTDSEMAGAEYIRKQFEGYGLTVRYEEFPIVASVPKEALVTFAGTSIEAYPLRNTKDSGGSGVMGELYFLDSITATTLKEIEGKVVLLFRYIDDRTWKKVLAEKPLAIIRTGREASSPPSHFGHSPERQEVHDCPIVCISYQDGVTLRSHEGRQITVVSRVDNFDAVSRNVIADLPGERNEEMVVLTAHYDSPPWIEGASDNGGGAVLLMELARVMAQTTTGRRPLRFIACGSEELGLRGSVHHVQNLPREEREHITLNINLDVEGIALGENSARLIGPDRLKTLVELYSRELGPNFDVSVGPAGSDFSSFGVAGIPSVSLGRSAPGVIHTIRDTLEICTPDALAVVGRFTQVLLERYEAAEELLVEREVPEKVMKQTTDFFADKLGVDIKLKE